MFSNYKRKYIKRIWKTKRLRKILSAIPSYKYNQGHRCLGLVLTKKTSFPYVFVSIYAATNTRIIPYTYHILIPFFIGHIIN